MQKLRITEIFHSLQGETSTVGIPTVFIRLTGCPLRCQYCDTEYAFAGGQWMHFDEIFAKVQQTNCKYITVTGGEPLAQPNCLALLTELCCQGYRVSLETSGAMDISEVDPRVTKIVDIKTPGSKQDSRNKFSNLDFLNPVDEIKFVICDQADYQWAKACIAQYDLTQTCQVLLSSSYQQLSPTQLADWIVKDQLPVRFQLQLHKVLWNDQPGR